MKKGTMIALAVAGGVLAVALMVFGMYASYNNTEIGLRSQIKAVQKSNEAVFDAVWKIIKQQAQIADKYKDSFQDIYKGIMSERYSKGDGSLMKWITESNPNFDTKLYENVSNSIEAQRLSFLREQQKLLDLKREHDNILRQIPSVWFVGSRPEIEVVIVTSVKSDEAFKTGKEELEPL